MDDSSKYNILDNVTHSKTSFLQEIQYRESGNRIDNKEGFLDIARVEQEWMKNFIAQLYL